MKIHTSKLDITDPNSNSIDLMKLNKELTYTTIGTDTHVDDNRIEILINGEKHILAYHWSWETLMRVEKNGVLIGKLNIEYRFEKSKEYGAIRYTDYYLYI